MLAMKTNATRCSLDDQRGNRFTSGTTWSAGGSLREWWDPRAWIGIARAFESVLLKFPCTIVGATARRICQGKRKDFLVDP